VPSAPMRQILAVLGRGISGGGHEGIEVARWLREVCDVPIVFVTGYTDRDTIERIHEVVPDAPVLPKLNYRNRLADAVAEM
jgi:DNA-binding NarL/FixJ family response regulator